MITAFKDKTFEWKMRSPPTSYFVKKAAGVASGSGRPGHGQTAQISLKHVYHIAQLKSRDEGAQHIAMESMCRSVISAAKVHGNRGGAVIRPRRSQVNATSPRVLAGHLY
jgi:large subunit ribosomal protein L11